MFFSLSLSKTSSEKLRNESATLFTPLWERLFNIKTFVMNSFTSTKAIKNQNIKAEIQQLRIENQLLKLEMDEIHYLHQNHQKIKMQLESFKDIAPEEINSLELESDRFFKQNLTQIARLVKALPARVIFRSFDQWNSVVWINVGQKDNEKLNMTIVAKNSPVLIDDALVGVIDYVDTSHSRVRLISDPSLTPSVRAMRGGDYDNIVISNIDYILQALSTQNSPLDEQENQQLYTLLRQLKHSLQPYKKSWYLAKGELRGSILPLGYSPPLLKGTGFNYDFDDDEGVSRDLRTGESNAATKEPALPILKVNDVLITTGMDGIFPAGLKVAIVSKVNFLKEGDYFYELEARPIATQLEELTRVFVIPPLKEFKEFSLK